MYINAIMSHPSNQYKHSDTPSLLFPNTKNGYLQYGIKDASFVIGGVLSPPKTCSCEQYTKPKLREGVIFGPFFKIHGSNDITGESAHADFSWKFINRSGIWLASWQQRYVHHNTWSRNFEFSRVLTVRRLTTESQQTHPGANTARVHRCALCFS